MATKKGFAAFNLIEDGVAGLDAEIASEARRRKLVAAIEHQIMLYENVDYKEERRRYVTGPDGERTQETTYVIPKAWWAEAGGNKFFVRVKFGVNKLVIDPDDKSAKPKTIALLEHEVIPQFLQQVLETANAGMYDPQLEEISKKRKRNKRDV